MSDINYTVELINQYIQAQLLPMSGVDFFVQYIVPILQLAIIVGGSCAGLYKYFRTKNREIYQQLLSEVYAPLYQYFVKQELLRKLVKLEGDYHETPVLEYTIEKTTNNLISGSTTTESKPVLNLNRQNLISVLDSINIGLAPKELYTLLSMYKVLVYMEETSDKRSDLFLTSTILKVDVENKLRREIISGYKKNHEKLGIKSGADNDFFSLSADQLDFNITVTEEEKKKLMEMI